MRLSFFLEQVQSETQIRLDFEPRTSHDTVIVNSPGMSLQEQRMRHVDPFIQAHGLY